MFGFNVFTAPGKPMAAPAPPAGEASGWDPTTATLIYGPREALLVDTLTTVAEATALADWVALHDRALTTIYVTHGHFDHFYGASVLRERFPEARVIATPRSVALAEHHIEIDGPAGMRQRWPGQIPAELVVPEPYSEATLDLEGLELRIVEQGRTDTVDTTSVHVPGLGLVVGGDVVYNQCHMFVGSTTADSRATWIAALDRLAALDATTVVAGHKKTGVPDTPAALDDSRRYLRDYDELVAAGTPDLELFQEMTRRYPDWTANQWWLMFRRDPSNPEVAA